MKSIHLTLGGFIIMEEWDLSLVLWGLNIRLTIISHTSILQYVIDDI